MKLILKSLLICLALLAAYHVAVKGLPAKLRSGGGAGSQPERNLMAAQNYFYGRGNPPVVVVGSSISERLHDLPDGWYKLAFPGGNSFTGMEVILRSGKKPRVVLVETNVLNMDPDRQMLDSLTYPGLSKLRNKLPELQEQNKPSHVLVRALNRKGGEKREADPIPPDFFAKLKQRRLGELSKPLPPARLSEIVARLHRDVAALEKRGVRVVFFEVPELPESENQPLKASIRDRVRAEFPEPRYAWVPAPAPEQLAGYHTTDAVHLDPPSAASYCHVLAGYMAPLLTPDAGAFARTAAGKPAASE